MINEVDTISVNPFSRRIEYNENNQLLGYLEYSLIYDRIEIDNILVSEDNRHQGIGTKLMAYLVNQAINLRVVNITLEVRVSNTKAFNLYQKYGFEKVGLRKNYYNSKDGTPGEDAYTMQLSDIESRLALINLQDINCK